MDASWLYEEEHALLRNELSEKLQRKHALELEISKQFEQLKQLEIAIEKTSTLSTRSRARKV